MEKFEKGTKILYDGGDWGRLKATIEDIGYKGDRLVYLVRLINNRGVYSTCYENDILEILK